MELIRVVYDEPTREMLDYAQSIKKTYKLIMHNGKISHYVLINVNDKKPCASCGGR